MSAIKIENVTFSYSQDSAPVVNDLSLEINEGEFVAICGRNGSGKSTVSRFINGLLIPQKGTVSVFDKVTSDKKNLFDIRRTCGMVFQNPDNQMVASIVEDDVAFGPENLGIKREEIQSRIDFALKVTDTSKFKDKNSSNLSGGQKQRVAIAGVLALKPKILILDESTSMLDPVGRRDVMDVVKKLNKEEKITVLLVTHYMDEVVECDKVIVINKGSLLAQGTPFEIFSNQDVLLEAGLSLPLPYALSLKLRANGVDVGENLTKEALAENLCKLFQKI